jgi:hypothetical protein
MTYVLPIVIELGDAVDADLDALMSGTGPLSDEVEEVMRIIRERCASSRDKRTLVPIVAVYTVVPDRQSRRDG